MTILSSFGLRLQLNGPSVEAEVTRPAPTPPNSGMRPQAADRAGSSSCLASLLTEADRPTPHLPARGGSRHDLISAWRGNRPRDPTISPAGHAPHIHPPGLSPGDGGAAPGSRRTARMAPSRP